MCDSYIETRKEEKGGKKGREREEESCIKLMCGDREIPLGNLGFSLEGSEIIERHNRLKKAGVSSTDMFYRAVKVAYPEGIPIFPFYGTSKKKD